MGKWGWGTSPPSPSPFQCNCGENGENGGTFGDDFHPHPPPQFFHQKKSPNGDGDAGNWGPGEKCASLFTTL